jgi:hypothetical protein
VDKERYPPTVCPTHAEFVVMVRYEAYHWPGIPISMSKRDVIKAFQQMVLQLSRMNFMASELKSMFPNEADLFPAVMVMASAQVFGSSVSPSNFNLVTWLAVELARNSGPHPDDILLAPDSPFGASAFVDDFVNACAKLGAGERAALCVRAIESAMLAILQGTGRTILNQKKMATEGNAAHEKRIWGTDAVTRGMEWDKHAGYMQYPRDKVLKFLRTCQAESATAGSRLVTVLAHLRLQGLALQVAELSDRARAALPGLFQMCQFATGSVLHPVGTPAMRQRAWDEYDSARALLLHLAMSAEADERVLRKSFYEYLPAQWELTAPDGRKGLVAWANSDANGMENGGGAGVVTATD